MRVEVFEDPAEFLTATDQFLLTEEANHNLILSFAASLVQSPGLTHNFFARIVDEKGVVHGAALWVPGRRLIATSCPKETLSALVTAVGRARDSHQQLDGLYAPETTAHAFSELWAELTNRKFEAGLKQTIMELKLPAKIKPKLPPGRFRRAWLEDLRLIRSWALAMAVETKVEEPPEETAELTRRMIEARRIFVWDANGPIAMAGLSGNTINGARINSVYVPPEHRRKGYARACTWSLGDYLSKSGKKLACLFADSDNPASIALYESLGYKIVGDLSDYRLVKSSSSSVTTTG